MNHNSADLLDLHSCTENLKEVSEGLWINKSQDTEVSYPESHHDLLLEEQETSFWYRHRKKCLSQVLKTFPTPVLLDIGASNGVLSAHLSKSTQVAMLEPHAAGIQNAARLGVKPLIQSSFQQAGFKENCIPAAGLFDVLEHIEDDLSFLKEVVRCLQPGARLYITVPAYQTLWSDFDKRVGHFRRYNRQNLTKTLIDAGLQIEYFTYLFSPLPIPILFKRTFNSHEKSAAAGNHHYNINSLMGRILNALLRPEYFMIKNKLGIPLGSSCLCVASKPEQH